MRRIPLTTLLYEQSEMYKLFIQQWCQRYPSPWYFFYLYRKIFMQVRPFERYIPFSWYSSMQISGHSRLIEWIKWQKTFSFVSACTVSFWWIRFYPIGLPRLFSKTKTNLLSFYWKIWQMPDFYGFYYVSANWQCLLYKFARVPRITKYFWCQQNKTNVL